MEVFADEPPQATSPSASQASQPLNQSKLTPEEQRFLELHEQSERLVAELPPPKERNREQVQKLKKIWDQKSKAKKALDGKVDHLTPKKAAMSNTERWQRWQGGRSVIEKQRVREANAEAQRRLRENKKQTGGQFKCSLCEPEEAFERREALMRHMKDHYKHDKPKSKDNEAFRYILKYINNLVHNKITYFFVCRKKSALEKQQERDAAYERVRSSRAKRASQQVHDEIVDKPIGKHNEAFRYILKYMNNLVHKYNHLLFCLQEKVCFRKATRKRRCL